MIADATVAGESEPYDEATVVAEVVAELRRACFRFEPLASPHEGVAVIEEEFLELRKEVYEVDGRAPAAIAEAVQLAAMAMRYVLDLGRRR